MLKKSELRIDRENPLMQAGDSYILFLKTGNDERVGPLYYVTGEYQGKYQIQGDKVSSVNPDAKTQATISRKNVDQFKAKIRQLVKAAA